MTRDRVHEVRCQSCGWTNRRVFAGISQPCPKCSGRVKEIKP